MTVVWIVMIGFGAALGGAVLLRARNLRRRTDGLVTDLLEARSGEAAIAVGRGRHLRTCLGAEDACLPGLEAGRKVELAVTARELTSGDAWIPLSRVTEVSFVASFEGWRASGEVTLMCLQWRRGGMKLSSVWAIEGPRVSAERLRKEIHLRIALPAA